MCQLTAAHEAGVAGQDPSATTDRSVARRNSDACCRGPASTSLPIPWRHRLLRTAPAIRHPPGVVPRRLRALGSRCEYLAVVLIGQRPGRLRRQGGIGQDSGGRPPFSRHSMQCGMHVKVDYIASGVDDVTDEFLTLAIRKMANPREDHRQRTFDRRAPSSLATSAASRRDTTSAVSSRSRSCRAVVMYRSSPSRRLTCNRCTRSSASATRLECFERSEKGTVGVAIQQTYFGTNSEVNGTGSCQGDPSRCCRTRSGQRSAPQSAKRPKGRTVLVRGRPRPASRWPPPGRCRGRAGPPWWPSVPRPSPGGSR